MVELSARAEGRIYRIFLAKLGKVSQAHVSIIEPSCDTNTHYAYYLILNKTSIKSSKTSI